MNTLQELHTYGQSFWLDYIQRGLITSGELQRLVREDGLRGVTSNPAIFEKAISGSNDYTDTLLGLCRGHLVELGVVGSFAEVRHDGRRDGELGVCQGEHVLHVHQAGVAVFYLRMLFG